MSTPRAAVRQLVLTAALLVLAAVRVSAKPPDLPLPTHPDLAPEERPEERPATYFVPAGAGLFLDLGELEEQEARKAPVMQPAGALLRLAVRLCVGPFTSGLGGDEECEKVPAVPREAEKLPKVPREADPKKSANQEAEIQGKLDMPVNVNFKDAPLKTIVDDFRSLFGLNIVIDKPALRKAKVSTDVPVTAELEGVSMKSALNILCRQAGLTWVMRDGTIVVTTRTTTKMVQKAYQVGDLIGDDPQARKLVRLVRRTIDVDGWNGQGGKATFDFFPMGQSLVVNQTPDVQEQIEDLFQHIRRARRPQPRVIAAYDVSDLVTEVNVAGNNVRRNPAHGHLKAGALLVKLVGETIKPGTWKDAVEYSGGTRSLVVRHDEETQARVSALLENLRNARVARSKSGVAVIREAHAALTRKRAGGEEPSSDEKAPAGTDVVLVTMGYDVSELLVEHELELDRAADRARLATRTDADKLGAELVGLIERGVEPKSWGARGGKGRLDFNPALKTLFVTQTAEVHARVFELLEARRREISLHKKTVEGQVAAGLREQREARVGTLLEECRCALGKGNQEEAEAKMHAALRLDPVAAAGHPLVYKVHLFAQVLAWSDPMFRSLPGIAPAVVRAYEEVLKNAGPCIKPAVLEVTEEKCELEIVPERAAPGGLCVDVDKGRVRVRVRLGPLMVNVTRDGTNGNGSLSLGVRLLGGK